MSERRIGMWGAVATLVGYVIGASIFVLPAQLLPTLGAGVILAYVVAAVPAVFTCLAGAVIGNTFPVSGASFVAVRDTLGRQAAVVVGWLLIWAAAIGTALVAHGLADYAAFVWPGIDTRVAALGAVAAFMLVNLTPASVTVGVQGAMVLGFAVVIAAFAAAGLGRGEWASLAAMERADTGELLGGAVAAYFSYAGLQVLIDIGGEVRDPGRTIPRALALSFAIVLLLYVGFITALVLLAGAQGTDLLAPALIGRVAEQAFGGWAGQAIVWSALLAAATSINGILFTQARDLQALAADGCLPRGLAATTNGVPRPAVLALGGMALFATAFGASVRDYAVLTALCLMAIQGALGLVVLRIPSRAAAAWSGSAFRPSGGAMAMIGWGLVVVSGLFFLVGATQSTGNLAWFAGLLASGMVVARRRPTGGVEG
jgi:APA family basic amino acid/polyamine antiporter